MRPAEIRESLTPEQREAYDRTVADSVDFIEDLLDGRAKLTPEVQRQADELMLQGARLGALNEPQTRALGRQLGNRHQRRAAAALGRK